MASILRVNTLTDASSNNSVPMATVNQGTTKHWARYDQTTATLHSSFNTSSIEDTSTGKITANISSAFSSATNYSTSGSKGSTTYNFTISPIDASSYNGYQRKDDGTYADATAFSFQAVGDLA
jgi:hypothetical protein